MSTPKCTLRDIAKACGYSTATVSMALRNMARVPRGTRERVVETAAAMGYVRDFELANCMSRLRRPAYLSARGIFAFLSESPIPATATATPWLRGMFHAAKDAAHLLGYDLTLETISPDPASQKMLTHKLWARGIRGLVIGPITTWNPAALALEWEHFAGVELGTTLQSPTLHRVERDFYDDLLELYERLYSLGYRRIGLALSRTRMEFMRYMPESTLLFFERHHPEMKPTAPLYTRAKWNVQIFRHWLAEEKPDVLLVYEPDVSSWLTEMKIRIPRDLGVAYLSSTGGKQSGLIPDTNLLAQEAIHLLARMVEGGEWGLPHRPRLHRFRNIFHLGWFHCSPIRYVNTLFSRQKYSQFL